MAQPKKQDSLTIDPTSFNPINPVIVQSDRSILLEVHNPLFEPARAALSAFAELEKSPEHIHTYRITPLSLWNAASAGFSATKIITVLVSFAKYPVPQNVLVDIKELAGRWGRVKLRLGTNGNLILESSDVPLMQELARHRSVTPYLGEALSEQAFAINGKFRGVLKQTLISVGWPVEDLAGYSEGTVLPIELRRDSFNLRDYQEGAAEAFHLAGSEQGGSGVIVLPCGAGKTIVGLAAMAKVGQSTLILTTSRTSVHQWQRELLAKTSLTADQVIEYAEARQIGPVTLTTYQMLSHRDDKYGDFPHMQLFNSHNWGLIIYDEVHTLPAPVFRMTAEVQAKRRLGLTATLIREDGREEDVFSLIGPKKYDVPWRELEGKGWIAEALCTEVRCSMSHSLRMSYAVATPKEKFRIASENPAKIEIVGQLHRLYKDAPTLVIGQYIDQLKLLAASLQAPLITGKTVQKERDRLYEEFRQGTIRLLVLSKVGNFALDLPDAEVLIQVSGTFGSRQEEAQRLGRVLRPKSDGKAANFYTLVSRETEEEDYAHHRQLFLTEQGYTYKIIDAEELSV